MIKEMDLQMLFDTPLWVSVHEIVERTGASRSSVHHHLQGELLHGHKYGYKTFILPEDAEKYCRLYTSGILPMKKERA